MLTIGVGPGIFASLCYSLENYWIRLIISNQTFKLLHIYVPICKKDFHNLTCPLCSHKEYTENCQVTALDMTTCYTSCQDFQISGSLELRYHKVKSSMGNELYSYFEIHIVYIECDDIKVKFKTNPINLSPFQINNVKSYTTANIHNINTLYY
jgi:hypothetical protein